MFSKLYWTIEVKLKSVDVVTYVKTRMVVFSLKNDTYLVWNPLKSQTFVINITQ